MDDEEKYSENLWFLNEDIERQVDDDDEDYRITFATLFAEAGLDSEDGEEIDETLVLDMPVLTNDYCKTRNREEIESTESDDDTDSEKEREREIEREKEREKEKERERERIKEKERQKQKEIEKQMEIDRLKREHALDDDSWLSDFFGPLPCLGKNKKKEPSPPPMPEELVELPEEFQDSKVIDEWLIEESINEPLSDIIEYNLLLDLAADFEKNYEILLKVLTPTSKIENSEMEDNRDKKVDTEMVSTMEEPTMEEPLYEMTPEEEEQEILMEEESEILMEEEPEIFMEEEPEMFMEEEPELLMEEEPEILMEYLMPVTTAEGLRIDMERPSTSKEALMALAQHGPSNIHMRPVPNFAILQNIQPVYVEYAPQSEVELSPLPWEMLPSSPVREFQSPEMPVTPTNRDMPAMPVTPTYSGVVPLTPVTPTNRDMPLIPVTPTNRDMPLMPVTPTNRDMPLMPVTPPNRDMPAMPVTPTYTGVVPLIPVTPTNRDMPAIPVTPTNKERPSIPITPTYRGEMQPMPVTPTNRVRPPIPITPKFRGVRPAMPVTPTVIEVMSATPGTPTVIGVRPAVPGTPTIRGVRPAMPVTPTVIRVRPAMPVTPSNKVTPAMPGTPTYRVVKSQIPVTPTNRAMSTMPVTPTNKGMPAMPGTPTVIRVRPAMPVTPSNKVTPAMQGTPTFRRVKPQMPVTPANRAMPTMPVTPTNKGMQAMPGTPTYRVVKSQIPVTPKNRAMSTMPVTPTNKGMQAIPGTPTVIRVRPAMPVTPSNKVTPAMPGTPTFRRVKPQMPVTPANRPMPTMPVTPTNKGMQAMSGTPTIRVVKSQMPVTPTNRAMSTMPVTPTNKGRPAMPGTPTIRVVTSPMPVTPKNKKFVRKPDTPRPTAKQVAGFRAEKERPSTSKDAMKALALANATDAANKTASLFLAKTKKTPSVAKPKSRRVTRSSLPQLTRDDLPPPLPLPPVELPPLPPPVPPPPDTEDDHEMQVWLQLCSSIVVKQVLYIEAKEKKEKNEGKPAGGSILQKSVLDPPATAIFDGEFVGYTKQQSQLLSAKWFEQFGAESENHLRRNVVLPLVQLDPISSYRLTSKYRIIRRPPKRQILCVDLKYTNIYCTVQLNAPVDLRVSANALERAVFKQSIDVVQQSYDLIRMTWIWGNGTVMIVNGCFQEALVETQQKLVSKLVDKNGKRSFIVKSNYLNLISQTTFPWPIDLHKFSEAETLCGPLFSERHVYYVAQDMPGLVARVHGSGVVQVFTMDLDPADTILTRLYPILSKHRMNQTPG